MPGWTAIAEALMRGPHHPSSDFYIGSGATCALDALQLLRDDVDFATLTASLSLDATVRKRLWGVVLARVPGAHKGLACAVAQALHPKVKVADAAGTNVKHDAAALLGALVRAVSAISKLLLRRAQNRAVQQTHSLSLPSPSCKRVRYRRLCWCAAGGWSVRKMGSVQDTPSG